MSILTAKSDLEIQQDVLSEIEWDPRVEPNEVGVQVDRGIVTLTGRITSYAKKIAARDAAHRVLGVHDVVNNLVVTLPNELVQTDTAIARAVRHALEWDVLIPDHRIRTTVSNGWVTLEGTVDNWSQRRDAELAVERLTGVLDVQNRIEIRPAAKMSAEKIQRLIEAALGRQASHEADRIEVHVKDGVVTLKGRLQSAAEKHAVLNVASIAPGVVRVENLLSIDSPN